MELTFCTRCVCDGSIAEITYNEKGVCNFCLQAEKSLKEIEAEKHTLPEIINRIKKDGQGKKYDCVLGLSGGVDSSTALHHAVRLGLRPLTFGMDNGWNSPTSDENVMRLVEGLKVPYERRVIDLAKFRELQGAFLKAGLINVEIPTDHIIMALTYEVAKEHGVKWILSGGNVATESIMPESWSYPARDLIHIKDVYHKMTGKRLTGLPMCGLLKWNWIKWIRGVKTVYLLDFIDYNRAESIKLLEREYGWKDYGAKHEENIFTSWFQNFYLFTKFGIDKRKAHLSSLIIGGQMTITEAKEILALRPIYPELGLEKKVMPYKKRSHYDFKTDEKLWKFITTTIRALRKPFRKSMSIGKAIRA